MTEHEIKMEIWAINQSIAYLEDIYYRYDNEDSKRDLKRRIEKLEAEKSEYYKKWRNLKITEARENM